MIPRQCAPRKAHIMLSRADYLPSKYFSPCEDAVDKDQIWFICKLSL
jgi:hypothetical protein